MQFTKYSSLFKITVNRTLEHTEAKQIIELINATYPPTVVDSQGSNVIRAAQFAQWIYESDTMIGESKDNKISVKAISIRDTFTKAKQLFWVSLRIYVLC